MMIWAMLSAAGMCREIAQQYQSCQAMLFGRPSGPGSLCDATEPSCSARRGGRARLLGQSKLGQLRKRTRRTGKSFAGAHHVLLHLRNQRLDPVEFLLRSQPCNECHIEQFAIEVAREVKEEDFEQHGTLIEHGPTAEAGHSVVKAPMQPDAHRVNAMRQSTIGLEL